MGTIQGRPSWTDEVHDAWILWTIYDEVPGYGLPRFHDLVVFVSGCI